MDGAVGARVPRRGNAFTRGLGRLTMRLMGWRLVGQVPDIPKFVAIAAPHSSNWDFVVAMAVAFAIGVRVTVLGKHTLFKGPLAPLMRFLDVMPVNRAAPQGVVGDCVAAFDAADQLVIGVAPDGTRGGKTGAGGDAGRWKSGFYRIARAARVPVLPVALDYGRREARFGPVLIPTGDEAADLAQLSLFYAGTRGKRRSIGAAVSF
ncbi:lysophospholipid acyltransferase family protein [Nitrospirillum iridis]|uniref:1-acyl-sn-glycerol-3-phosphate acyltransferase n=1 Tax=Nitrospirillum iridis TaxID=765888 RepID=A0A7X0EB93_9PROT|nr:lysophospholipid acyltransferase family protein [Nitrospirillum iridis]MBB6250407.1 1-acyl-sn-glycerol-3-phosphate acyltransferase [Nitrospirillum iridis]